MVSVDISDAVKIVLDWGCNMMQMQMIIKYAETCKRTTNPHGFQAYCRHCKILNSGAKIGRFQVPATKGVSDFWVALKQSSDSGQLIKHV